jgi:hypothetical protein
MPLFNLVICRQQQIIREFGRSSGKMQFQSKAAEKMVGDFCLRLAQSLYINSL